VVMESGDPKAYGAGLLSSFGELEAFRGADLREWDLVEMGTLEYDITHYQPVLFVAPSFESMYDRLAEFFRTF
jgi:phenylalanine-4-hydroxylase